MKNNFKENNNKELKNKIFDSQIEEINKILYKDNIFKPITIYAPIKFDIKYEYNLKNNLKNNKNKINNIKNKLYDYNYDIIVGKYNK
jgi:hypothetical protein